MHVKVESSVPVFTPKLEVLQNSQYFHFRDDRKEQKKLVQMRLVSEGGSAFVIISPRSFPLWSTLYLEFQEKKIIFGKYNGISAKETTKKDATLTGVLDLWLFFDGLFVYVGKQGNATVQSETLAKFFSKQMPEVNHLGFSIKGTGEWTIKECE